MGINVGDLRHKIVLKEVQATKDQYGSITEIWNIRATLRAGIKYLGGSKAINNDEVFTSNIIEVTTHYRSYINAKHRIEFQGNKYIINDIQPIGLNEGLRIMIEKINE